MTRPIKTKGAISRAQVITAAGTSRSVEHMAFNLGYSERASARRRLVKEGVRRRLLPCGVFVVEARK